eukprot:gene5862-biopygen5888
MRWVEGHPPKFDHESSLRDLTPQQREWLDIGTDRSPGTNSWRHVMDFRWLNAFCLKSKSKMETLKKLRRVTSQGDWCFSFDLKDGYHAVGIDPEFQEFMQFDIQGVLYQCSALPFGLTVSPRIFVSLVKTLMKLIRSPQAGKNRYEVKKLRDGQETQDDAFVQRDRVEKLLSRLGLFQNEKKGHWEATQLVEHLGLEVDFTEGLFRVTEARPKKIHAKATGLIC